MKRLAWIAATTVVLISACLIYYKALQVRRDAHYRTELSPYARNLHSGMPRQEVRKYLESRNIAYGSSQIGPSPSATYLIKIGEDPGSLVCEPWNVYVALEFDADDRLSDVHIRKIGTCL